MAGVKGRGRSRFRRSSKRDSFWTDGLCSECGGHVECQNSWHCMPKRGNFTLCKLKKKKKQENIINFDAFKKCVSLILCYTCPPVDLTSNLVLLHLPNYYFKAPFPPISPEFLLFPRVCFDSLIVLLLQSKTKQNIKAFEYQASKKNDDEKNSDLGKSNLIHPKAVNCLWSQA